MKKQLSKEEINSYLHTLLFERRKALAEFERNDLEMLHRLRLKTMDDLIGGNGSIELLLELEFEYRRLIREIKILEAKTLEIKL